MDFDKPKVYGDTSITDGLVFPFQYFISLFHVHQKPHLVDDPPNQGVLPKFKFECVKFLNMRCCQNITVYLFGKKTPRELDPVGSTVRYEMMKLLSGSV